ncbi:hypothetical protein JAAARDRAFT_46734 [Jaapia argillacea MUCL 33604]|uniref:DUF7029 domain-containing protein n=1 Tax=Jaapia argillacea MUCL 33604 TaxID=933084 RepID=A0A067PWK5_9AGAM|nr:hypothetical protein JAAARDRAFT_46734 [Jaapia argillacea MUCL 33604]
MYFSSDLRVSLFCTTFFLLVLPCFSGKAAGTVLAERPNPFGSRNLLPLRRALPLTIRDTEAVQLTPKDTITLDYNHREAITLCPLNISDAGFLASPGSPLASVTLTAHEDLPIVLLEEIDHLLESVACTFDDRSQAQTHVVELKFWSEATFNMALSLWSSLDEFRLVTSHSTCNTNDERGAWHVVAVNSDHHRLALILFVETLDLKQVGQSFKVHYEQSNILGGWGSQGSKIHSRESYPIDMAYNSDMSPRYQLLNLTQQDQSEQTMINASLEIYCVGCVSRTNFSLTLDFDGQFSGIETCVTNPDQCFNLTIASADFQVVEFEQLVELEISMQEAISVTYSQDVINVQIGQGWNSHFQIFDLFTISPRIGLAVAFDFDMYGSANFSFGANASIPQGASAGVDFVGPSANATGWNGAGVQIIPFRLNSGSFNMSSTAALSPFIGVLLTAGSDSATARITSNVPTVYFDSAVVEQVNRECNPIGDDDFESFDVAFSLGAGMNLSTVASLTLDAGFESLPHDWNTTFWEHWLPFLPDLDQGVQKCYIIAGDAPSTTASYIDKSLQTLIPAPTGTLVIAASAVPTFNIPKIESYYSAQGHLPTNVNYTQLVKATPVPGVLQKAIDGIVKSGGLMELRPGGWKVMVVVSFLVPIFLGAL